MKPEPIAFMRNLVLGDTHDEYEDYSCHCFENVIKKYLGFCERCSGSGKQWSRGEEREVVTYEDGSQQTHHFSANEYPMTSFRVLSQEAVAERTCKECGQYKAPKEVSRKREHIESVESRCEVCNGEGFNP